MGERVNQFVAIDLKSFYASVECIERGLDPMRVHLVVADETRTEKTICLAVSPALKAHGVPGRPRLFEVNERVRAINAERKRRAPGRQLTGKSVLEPELEEDPALALDFVIAPPRMERYMQVSTRIFNIYQKYISPEDIHVYSIDEVFIDVTKYLAAYKLTAHELAMRMIKDVYAQTGITATAGIGTNLYLCKVAMDVVAKHVAADADGVRIAELDEMSYRRALWTHRPLTDFWRVGPGYAKKLEEHGLYTMGDVARCSLTNEKLLYKLFGVNAELLIDHAWGWESCTMSAIKAYKPSKNSLGAGQVLQAPYSFEMGKLVVREMTEALVLDLVEKELVTDQMVLTVGYDVENCRIPALRDAYRGEIVLDRYGREHPKNAHGTATLKGYTSSTKEIVAAVMELYDRIVQRELLVRRMYVVAGRVINSAQIPPGKPVQLDLFTDYAAEEEAQKRAAKERERERSLQEATIGIHKKFGKNALVKGMDLEEGATAIDRNGQIGGHKK